MGIFSVGVILGWNFLGASYPEWEFSGWEFSGGELFWVGICLGGIFPGGNCPRGIIRMGILRVGVFLVLRNEVMQPTTSFKHLSQLFLNHVHNQAGFVKSVINGRDHIYLGISKLVFTLGKLERLIFDHMRIILGSWKSRY